jgi:ribose transport system permease protein
MNNIIRIITGNVVFKVIRKTPLFLALIMLILFFFYMERRFLSERNIYNIFLQISILTPVAIGQLLVILTGGIDLSVGSILAISSAVCAGMMKAGNDIYLSCIVAILIGTTLGIINGINVVLLKLTPLVATLGMMGIAKGMQLSYSLGSTIYPMPDKFRYLAMNTWLRIPGIIYLIVVIFIIFILIMRYTILGRSIYAIGGNSLASKISGVPVKLVTFGVYAISGIMSSIGGLILLMRMNAAESSAGSGLEMDAIAAVVIGGTSLSGGRGSVIKTGIGILIYGIILNGLNIIGISPFIQRIVVGLLIIFAVAIDSLVRAKENYEI